MKAIILAGGLGTRISEETSDKPKPMVLLDDKPIIWHLMNVFANQGICEFVIATGYRHDVIDEWVSNLKTEWEISVLDTGLHTQTGGRIKQCMDFIGNERVFATYGDGLGNINIPALIEFHDIHKVSATVTAVRPPARFGVLETANGIVTHFGEKSQTDAGWINGGFFVLEPEVSDFISGNHEPFETGAMPRLVERNQLAAYHHSGFWQPMDTLREKNELKSFAQTKLPPWLAGIIND